MLEVSLLLGLRDRHLFQRDVVVNDKGKGKQQTSTTPPPPQRFMTHATRYNHKKDETVTTTHQGDQGTLSTGAITQQHTPLVDGDHDDHEGDSYHQLVGHRQGLQVLRGFREVLLQPAERLLVLNLLFDAATYRLRLLLFDCAFTELMPLLFVGVVISAVLLLLLIENTGISKRDSKGHDACVGWGVFRRVGVSLPLSDTEKIHKNESDFSAFDFFTISIRRGERRGATRGRFISGAGDRTLTTIRAAIISSSSGTGYSRRLSL